MKPSLASFLPSIDDRALVGQARSQGIVLPIEQSKTLSFKSECAASRLIRISEIYTVARTVSTGADYRDMIPAGNPLEQRFKENQNASFCCADTVCFQHHIVCCRLA